jgi:hypothetical protein
VNSHRVHERPPNPAAQQSRAKLRDSLIQNPHQRSFACKICVVLINLPDSVLLASVVFATGAYAQICKTVTIEKHVRSGCEFGKEVRRHQRIGNAEGCQVFNALG